MNGQQVLLLQRRSLELEDVGAREASSRRETQAEAEKLEVQMVEAKKQIEELQKKVSAKDAALQKVPAASAALLCLGQRGHTVEF